MIIQSGSDRVFEAATIMDPEASAVILNVQRWTFPIERNHSPLLPCRLPDRPADLAYDFAVRDLQNERENQNPNIVKVIGHANAAGAFCAPAYFHARHSRLWRRPASTSISDRAVCLGALGVCQALRTLNPQHSKARIRFESSWGA